MMLRRHAHRNHVDRRIPQELLVIRISILNVEKIRHLVQPLPVDVSEGNDLDALESLKRRQMSGFGHPTATDDPHPQGIVATPPLQNTASPYIHHIHR